MPEENQWEVAGTSPSGTPANQWEVDKTEDSARPAVAKGVDDQGRIVLDSTSAAFKQGGMDILHGAEGALIGAASAPAAIYSAIRHPLTAGKAAVGGAIAGANAAGQVPGAIKDILASPGGSNRLLNIAGQTAGEAGPNVAALAATEAAGPAVAESRAGRALIAGGKELPFVKPFVKAYEALGPESKALPVERDATALNKPFAGEDLGPDTLVGKTKDALAEGRANKLPTKVSSNYTPGAQNKILVHPGTAANEAAEAAGPARAARGGVIVAPEPTKTLIGGPKTAFSLPLGKPLDSAVQAGNADAALIKGVREGKPVILSPREGTGYPGPRTESAPPIIERRGPGRSALATPTEVEKRMKTAPATARNIVDDTEGANATIARDVDRLVGPARPGEPVQIHGGHAGGGAASAEELARPGQHFIVTKNGVLNAEGKAFRPESTPSGGVHVTRMSDGTFKVNEGEITPTIRKALDKLNAELGKK